MTLRKLSFTCIINCASVMSLYHNALLCSSTLLSQSTLGGDDATLTEGMNGMSRLELARLLAGNQPATLVAGQ